MSEDSKFLMDSELLKEMQNLMKDMQQVDLHLNLQMIPEKVILLMGQTKAGKTTLMYYLLGKKLIREFNKQYGFYQMKPQAKIFDALIGNDFQSTTVYPNIPTELGEDKVSIIDMPGFSDTRCPYRLLNIYIVREVIKKIKEVHVSLVIPNSDLGASELINTIDRNCLLLNHKLLASPGCLSFILTKIESKDDEIECFHSSMEIMKQEKNELFDSIDTVLNAKTYIFENVQPQVQAGLQLKLKIISQNKFFPINQKPDNLLSSSYAQVISGQQNQQQFEQFLIKLLNGIVQTLTKVVELFSVLVQLHHLEDLQSVLLVQQETEQDLIERAKSLAQLIIIGDLNKIQLSFNQPHNQTTKVQSLLNLCKKYYKPKNKEEKPKLIVSLQHFAESADILANQESKVSSQLRKRIHKLFIFINNAIRTIYLIKNKVIVDYLSEIFNSAEITMVIQNYNKLPNSNDLIARIAHSQGCEQLAQNQEFRELIFAHNPNFAFQEGEEVIENVKVAVRGEIRNKKMNAALLQTMKLGNKSVDRQQNQKIKQVNDISRENIKEIKNMPITSNYLHSLLNTFSKLRLLLQNATEPLRIQFGVTLFRKIAQIMQKLQMFEEACLFYLAIPSEIQAQYLINTAISFKQLKPLFIKEVLLPYYSRINTNFQMVQKLYNYLSLNIFDYEQLLKNQQQMVSTLQEMRNLDINTFTLTKRFQFNFNDFIDNNKKEVIKRANRSEQFLISSKFMSLQREIMKLQHL